MMAASYQLRVLHELEDPGWDAFLVETPGGHHVQTSLWAQVKSVVGWRALRVVVTHGECIVAGAQVLLRSLPLVGAIGYVPKGPLLAVDDPVVTKLVIHGLHQVANAHRLQYLIVQPPSNGIALTHQLPTWGFHPSSIEVAPTATVVLDLTQGLDDLLAQMKPGTRYNLRHGLRRGITGRKGTEDDLRTFYRLLVATGRRQGFSPEPEAYFSAMWRIFRPHGYIRLFLAEYEGEAVSAHLAIAFGDTVLYKKGAWSGQHARDHPNEVLQWTAIRWAKSQGYRYYDLEGIEPKAATRIVRGESLTDPLRQTVTSFKLGFGGRVILYPRAYDHVYNPFLRWAHSTVIRKLASESVVQNAANRFRAR